MKNIRNLLKGLLGVFARIILNDITISSERIVVKYTDNHQVNEDGIYIDPVVLEKFGFRIYSKEEALACYKHTPLNLYSSLNTDMNPKLC